MRSRRTQWMTLLLAVVLVWAGSAQAEVVRGKVTAIDQQAKRISIQAESGNFNFNFDPEDFIVWKGDDEVKTDEIKTGADAEVGYYTDESGLQIASWVDLTPAEAGEEVTVPTESPAMPAMPHAEITPAPATTKEHAGAESPKERAGAESPEAEMPPETE